MIIKTRLHLAGASTITLEDFDTNDTTTFVRQSLVEQREADLLKSLELSEDTVDVLEQLLAKYTAEIKRLNTYNTLLRQLATPMTPAIPTPVSPSAPWVWPQQPSQQLPKVWCDANGLHYAVNIQPEKKPSDFFQFLKEASKQVDQWPEWKKRGFGYLFGDK